VPYKKKKKDDYEIRKFSKKTTDEDLIWHVDREDRLIFIRKSGGWKLQYDNQLPFTLEDNTYVFIPRGIWHRVIRGVKKLVVEIHKIGE
jgi:quercetin dioxygenase-like cupin family protein